MYAKPMNIAHFEQDNMHYDFEPPVEVGDVRIDSIHKLAALAVAGPDADEPTIDTLMHEFASVLKSNLPGGRVEAFRTFLEEKHEVTGARGLGGLPTWSSEVPSKAKIPGVRLSSGARDELQANLRAVSRADLGRRSMGAMAFAARR